VKPSGGWKSHDMGTHLVAVRVVSDSNPDPGNEHGGLPAYLTYDDELGVFLAGRIARDPAAPADGSAAGTSVSGSLAEFSPDGRIEWSLATNADFGMDREIEIDGDTYAFAADELFGDFDGDGVTTLEDVQELSNLLVMLDNGGAGSDDSGGADDGTAAIGPLCRFLEVLCDRVAMAVDPLNPTDTAPAGTDETTSSPAALDSPCGCPPHGGGGGGGDGDIDGDGIPNGSDPDVDGDGLPNWGDPDIDGDGVPNGSDPNADGDGTANGSDADVDGDGIGNGTDADLDGDGVPNGQDSDMDGDGIDNGSDPDPDGDGSGGGGGCTSNCQGACCNTSTGSCALKAASECSGSSQHFEGTDKSCTPSPCCPYGTNNPFPPANATIVQVEPSETLSGCLMGLTWAEDVRITYSARCDGTQWCAVVQSVTGAYSQEARLLPTQTEVTGPGGNTTGANHCDQAVELIALAFCPGSWYMIAAVQAHEDVHLAHFLPATQAAAPSIERAIESVCVPHTAGKTASMAEDEIDGSQMLRDARRGSVAGLQAAFNALVDGDHNGPTQAAEYSIVQPMALAICDAAQAQCWPVCTPCPARPTGACCNLVTGACSIETACQCVGHTGQYRGDDSTCGPPNPCVGACCGPAPDYTCTLTTTSGCTQRFLGTGTTCSPNLCGPPT